MKRTPILTILFLFIVIHLISQDKPDYVIVIHGGAGYMTPETISQDKQALYIEKLREALNVGKKILKNKGTAIEAVEQVINILEDSPLFNAGKGAVFTHDARNELDASIMDGQTLKAGAVAGVTDIKNPISAAIEVMNNSKHVLLSGKGASKFAKKRGLEIVQPEYFFTEDKYNYLKKVIEDEKEAEKSKHGTVGCVVLDKNGNLAAGTSTGGMTNKKYGRIGDSPIIGAGTYAKNSTCAVSCTGHGEYFIRFVVAYDVSAILEYKSTPLNEACSFIINDKLKAAGGNGGLIAIDKDGNIAMEFNTPGMFRAYSKSSGEEEILLFGKP